MDHTEDISAPITSDYIDDVTITTVTTSTLSYVLAIITINKTSDNSYDITNPSYTTSVIITLVYSKTLPITPYGSLRIISLSRPFLFGTHALGQPIIFYTRADSLPFILYSLSRIGVDKQIDKEATMITDDTSDTTKAEKNIDASKETSIVSMNQTTDKTATITTSYTIT